ncbi:MAG: phosphoribosylglycinamide formyltransferase [Loktanella sp.]|nr:phosphoribosylglycinamide formyltransferase [Loktanella sp.]
MRRVAVLISGSGSNMVSLVAAMQADKAADPVLVLSNRPDAGGLAKAAAFGVPTAVVDHTAFADRAAFEGAVHAELVAAKADLVCLAGFMRILGEDFTRLWEGRMLNIHPSLLPKYKGLNTHARAIAAGDEQAGCSVHEVTAELDDGPVLGQARLAIRPDDTPDTLAARILPLEHRLYPAVLRRVVAGDRSPVVIQG